MASTAGLMEVGKRPPLGEYLATTWRMRMFALRLAGSRMVSSLLPNRLGVLWIVLKPLSLAIIYGVVFHFILSGAARPENFVQFIIVGVFIFEFFTGCFGSGSKAITSNTKLVQSFGFPRILLPISVIAEQAMRMIPVVLLLGILLLVLGEPISWSWLLVVPTLAVMGLFNLGVALVVARLSVRTRDVQQLVPIVSRVLFYASGIFFDVDGALAEYPVLLNIVHLNPIYEFIAIARDVLLDGYSAPLLAWIAAPIWAVVMLIGGVVFFWRAEERYGLSD